MRPLVYLYSHSHWDREWYLSQRQFQVRLCRTIDEIIELITAGNGIEVFVLDGQTCVIQDYLELRPERASELRHLLATGRLVIGPWYSMPDDFLADGEALIRNFQRGLADCTALGAPWPKVGYVPDSFGHIEQLPQLLRGVGIDNFIFGRGRPVSMAVEAGHKQEFTWRAPDGSTVFAWHLPEAYLNAKFLPGVAQPDALRQRFEKMIATFAHSHRPELVLAAHGIDHTWLQRDIGAILRALPALMPEVDFHHGTLEDALAAWRQVMPSDLETWQGQLRGPLKFWELHGTLSSRADNKVMNDRARHYLENLAEPLDALGARLGQPSARHLLRKAWELVMQNHAHDSICGCSQDRVHEEVNARFRQASELATEVADRVLDLFNSAARQAGEPAAAIYAGLNGGHPVVEFVLRLRGKPRQPYCLVSEGGQRYPVQFVSFEDLRIVHTNATEICWEMRCAAYLPDLQPLELRRLRCQVDETRGQDPRLARPAQPVSVTPRSLDNGLLRVSVNPDGTLDLHDARRGQTVRGTHYFVQEADLGGGYHFEPLAGDTRRTTQGGKARVRVVARGPLRGQLEVHTTLRVPLLYDRAKQRRTGSCVIKLVSTLTLDADSETLQVRTVIDNPASHQRLRLVLPTGLTQREVYADASFAVHSNDPTRWPAEARQNSHPMRSLVGGAGPSGGLAFLGRGLHEYEIIPDDGGTALEITLLRSVDFVFLCSTWATPQAQLHGQLVHQYGLRLHAGDWRAGGVLASAAALQNPPIVTVSGDTCHPREHEDHATLGFYAKRGKVEVPVDTNRSPWHATNAHRDGWRRVEPDRFPRHAMPERLLPYTLAGKHLVISACKRADDGQGEILRFWSAAAEAQAVTVTADDPLTTLQRCDLLEQALPDTPSGQGRLTLTVRPFELVTLRRAAPTGPLAASRS